LAKGALAVLPPEKIGKGTPEVVLQHRYKTITEQCQLDSKHSNPTKLKSANN
jgi:hypothetical protein